MAAAYATNYTGWSSMQVGLDAQLDSDDSRSMATGLLCTILICGRLRHSEQESSMESVFKFTMLLVLMSEVHFQSTSSSSALVFNLHALYERHSLPTLRGHPSEGGSCNKTPLMDLSTMPPPHGQWRKERVER
ncbi:hypothetical protein TNIN_414061 [Trichonephila inaurata madagascariensis]|uniref:Uncharacterized protein n=1 Tax=Trichonephila inaurata madagascariensis TaxID=2747483 RepID=A0A8X7C9E3_9ARAC|nr:hypothetical protein TNIN_414061 [Trichonephila inaurata madagascariensis]